MVGVLGYYCSRLPPVLHPKAQDWSCTDSVIILYGTTSIRNQPIRSHTLAFTYSRHHISMSIPCCHSVFIRPLPPYLTLPLRQALTINESERYTDTMSKYQRVVSPTVTVVQLASRFCSHRCTQPPSSSYSQYIRASPLV